MAAFGSAPGAAALDQRVRSLIDRADSVAALLPLLPEEFRQNFTFVYDSRSPFKDSISPLHPRAILFSKDARTVLTFTSDPQKPGYDIVETMSFDDSKAKFTLEAFVLSAAKGRGVRPTSQQLDCARCHGADPRPIFDSYPLWPGFYGSIQDTFPQNSSVGRRELRDYQAFLKGDARHGIFKSLLFSDRTPVPPYLDPKLFHPDQLTGELNLFGFLPNTRLGMALTELNRHRLWRKLSASPYYASRSRQWLALLLDCDAQNEPVQNSVAIVGQQVAAENNARLRRMGLDPDDAKERVDDMQELKFLRALTQIDELANSAQVSRADWSMAMEPGSHAFFDGILSGFQAGRDSYLKEDWIFEILRDLAAKDKTLKPYFQSVGVYAWMGYPFGHRPELSVARGACKWL